MTYKQIQPPIPPSRIEQRLYNFIPLQEGSLSLPVPMQKIEQKRLTRHPNPSCLLTPTLPLCYNFFVMALTIEEVKKIAFLARLRLTPEEEARYAEQLSAILDYAQRLQEIDTSHIPPTASVLPLNAPLREDESRPSIPRERILSNASSQEEGMFRVPPVLDSEP